MCILVITLNCVMLLHFILALRVLPQDLRLDDHQQISSGLRKFLKVASGNKAFGPSRRRASNPLFAVDAALMKSLKKDLLKYNAHNYEDSFYRNKADTSGVDAQAITGDGQNDGVEDEEELTSTTNNKISALMARSYLQKKGKNDFLVMEQEDKDPFVAVVPNDIFYTGEKKCVNWLDSCTLQGIRAHLLQKVHSPYK